MLSVTNRSSFFRVFLGVCLITGSGFAVRYLCDYVKKDKTNDNPEDKTKHKKVEPSVHEVYINKYYDKFNNLEDGDIEESVVKSLKYSILYEVTPRGSVILFYDFEKESFCYYADTKDIPYLFLETVARRYVTVNHCKQIYVDMKAELLAANNTGDNKNITNGYKNTTDGQNILNNDKSSVHKSEPFASFKNYNRKGTGGTKATNLNKKFILRQNANRYSYLGKMKDFNMLNNAKYHKVKDPAATMDYNTFKKLLQSAK